VTANGLFLEQLADRLSVIASHICGEAHMELCDEVGLIRDVIRQADEPKAAPRRQALPASYRGASIGNRRGR
jgi:hypothetical protein